MVEVRPKLSEEEDAYKENRDVDYDAPSDEELDVEDVYMMMSRFYDCSEKV